MSRHEMPARSAVVQLRVATGAGRAGAIGGDVRLSVARTRRSSNEIKSGTRAIKIGVGCFLATSIKPSAVASKAHTSPNNTPSESAADARRRWFGALAHTRWTVAPATHEYSLNSADMTATATDGDAGRSCANIYRAFYFYSPLFG